MRTTKPLHVIQKSEPLLSKAAKMGQWPDTRPHSSPRKQKGAAYVNWLQLNHTATGSCLLINWNALSQKTEYPPLMKAIAA